MVFDFILYWQCTHSMRDIMLQYCWVWECGLTSNVVSARGQCGPHVRHKSFVEFVQFVSFLDPWSHNGYRANQPQSHRRGRGGEGRGGEATDSWYAIKQEWRISPQDATWGFYGPSCPGKKELEIFESFSSETPSQTNKAQVCYHLRLSSSIMCLISGSRRCLGCHFLVFAALTITQHLLLFGHFSF